MTTQQLAPTPTVRPGWGFTLRDDGRVALTYDGQLVATAACRSAVEQITLYSLYARLVSAHRAPEGRVTP